MKQTFHGTETYVASQELQEAVNIALALGKPLLIKGEPGTGKTVLAQAIAESMGRRLITWSVKSNHQGPGRPLRLRRGPAAV